MDGEDVSVRCGRRVSYMLLTATDKRQTHGSLSRTARPQHLAQKCRRLGTNGRFCRLGHNKSVNDQNGSVPAETITFPSFIDPKDLGLAKTQSGLTALLAPASRCADKVKFCEDRILPLGSGVTCGEETGDWAGDDSEGTDRHAYDNTYAL